METIFPGPSVRTFHDFESSHIAETLFFQGRIAGQDGKTKFTIENASRTRIILADS
jgi:rRNA processing protein Krr1/Pno1